MNYKYNHSLIHKVSIHSAEKGKWKKIVECEKPGGGEGKRPGKIEKGRNKLARLVM